MKFSVLIAHYNNATYFKDCYESLQKQTYTDWEAIIIDDCSSDAEKEMVKSIIANNSRFKFFENQVNKGVGYTKRRCIELATGEICGFVDPDDAILPTAIEETINVFNSKKDIVLTYSRLSICDQNLKPLYPFKASSQVLNNDPLFFNYPIQIAHFVAFRRDTYMKTIKINPELKIAEDQDLYYKLYEVGKVYFINKTNYLYRTHSGGISQNNNKKKSREYYALVIWQAMQRRNLKKINGIEIPETFSNAQEIFNLLEYQNKISYRIKKKILIILQKFSQQ
ncbi:glycosyl transferase family 2 [Chryseobacterium piperi]|uniref:Glycosyl transferase family 2 n=1 Tax=Chryseobacterium piperi TaxID=558152 RepID=A0A086BMV8_9FLAO|nr:glycosyltransferase [Chryseobacterium piperi]ASW75068.1 glycosyl transferase family 2 [Chryseobacterium piperi]KFF30272.1 glycosyl transferase family 2 [Chryseobacterium piperi]